MESSVPRAVARDSASRGWRPARTSAVVRRLSGRVGVVTLGVAAITLAACYDRATGPSRIAPIPRHDFLGDADWGVRNSTTTGSYDGVIDSVFGGAAAGPNQGAFPYPTFVRVRVAGTVRQVPGALPGDNIVRNPWAIPNDPNFWGAMGFNSNGGTWWAVDSVAVIRVVAPISVFRNRAGGQPRGDASHCGYPGYALCWTWAGSAHLEFERYPVDLTLTQSPDTTIWAGQSVTFTAGMNPASVPGDSHPIIMAELQWRWLPDSVGSADTVACGSTSGSSCTRVVTTPGTMFVGAYVNGTAQQQEVHIVVQTPQLKLTASKEALIIPGDSDSFLATGNGPTVIQGWSFTPDSVGGPPPSVAVGGSWGSCVPNVSACTNMVSHAGTVSVTGTVYGVQLTARTHVTLVPPRIILAASRTMLAAGDTATFTATATGTPLVVQGWAFRPDGDTSAAAIIGSSWGTCVPNVSQCTMPVPTTGTVYVAGTVGSFASSDSVHVTVSTTSSSCGANPTVSPSRPGQLATTRIGSQGSRTASATFNCLPDPNPSGPDSLLIDCHATGTLAGPVTRGNGVTCNARLRSGKRFTLDATATPVGAADGVGPRRVSFATIDSTFYATEGTAAVTTAIDGRGTRVEDLVILSSRITFAVNARATTPITLTKPSTRWASENDLATKADSGHFLVFGRYPASDYDDRAAPPAVRVVRAGPDSGLAFILTLPDTAPGGNAHINRALRGIGQWAADQANTSSHTDAAPVPKYSARWCRPSDFAHLQEITEIHEGSRGDGLPPYPGRTGTSHYDIRRSVIAEQLAPQLEQLVFDEGKAGSQTEVWGYINLLFNHVATSVWETTDHQFDTIEHAPSLLYSNDRFGCQDYYPWGQP